MSDTPREETERAELVEARAARVDPDEILIVRRGPGANCSSIGSALDILFLSATMAGVILASVAAALDDPEQPQRDDERGGVPGHEETDDARTR